VITNFISNAKDQLVLWAFRQACSDYPTKRAKYYDALVKIGELTKREAILNEVKRLSEEGKLIRKLNRWTVTDQKC
jgi:hypothetical protein